MHKIICETPFRKSIWCNEILCGLQNAIKKRRLNYTELTAVTQLASGDTLFVLGTDPEWLSSVINAANQDGITPIVLAPRSAAVKGQYHSVYTDLGKLMCEIIQSLRAQNKNKICLYGANPASVSDSVRLMHFNTLHSKREAVFYNNGSLDNCFASFLPFYDFFDAVICTNGLVAASLVQKLLDVNPSVLEKLTIIACTKNFDNTTLSEYILFADTQYDKLGNTALSIADTIKKNENITTVTFLTDYTVNCLPFKSPNQSAQFKLTEANEAFYADAEASMLLSVEKLLKQCDSLDLKILSLLVKNLSYNDIALQCFVSESAVKYRIKHYFGILGTSSKSNLVHALKKYYK